MRNHCLLHLDIMGSAYDLLTRPLQVNQRHIDMFRARVIQGRISKLDIKYLENSMINYNQTIDQEFKNLQVATNNSHISQEEKDLEITKRADFQGQVALHHELFQE